MNSQEPDIISKQTSVITVLCAIVLILVVCLFFLGYCEPRHVKMNESPAATEQGATSDNAASTPAAGTSTDEAQKKDTAQSK